MADLLIKDAEIKHIDALLGEIPLKYGIQLANYFSYLYQLRDREASTLTKGPGEVSPLKGKAKKED